MFIIFLISDLLDSLFFHPFLFKVLSLVWIFWGLREIKIVLSCQVRFLLGYPLLHSQLFGMLLRELDDFD